MQHFSPIKKRILYYIEYQGISKYKFYQDTGITRGVLDKDTGISEDNIAKFIAYYNNVNPTWLLTGEGEMLKGPEQAVRTEKPPPPVPDPKDAYIIELQAKQIAFLEKEINAYKSRLKECEQRELRAAELAMERKRKLEQSGEKTK